MTTRTSNGRARSIIYWICTGLVAFVLASGGVADVMRLPPVVEGMAHLGYPAYVCVIIGVWKLLGAIVLLAPRLPRLKEWAYAGTIFNMTGAAASHVAVGDDAVKVVVPLVIGTLAMVSWGTRAASRRLSRDTQARYWAGTVASTA